MRHVLFPALLGVLVTGMCLGLVEYGLRYFYFKPWAEQNIVGNPDHRMTRLYHDNVNNDGIRSKEEAAGYSADNFNIIFLGDSFTYGWRVMAGKTFPAQLEKLAKHAGYPTLRTVNFGWVSSSPYLSNRLLQDIGQKYHPSAVVLTVDMTDFFDDQLYENIVEKKHFFAIGQYLPAITQLLSLLNQTLWQSDAFAQTLFGVPGKHFFIVEQPLEQTRPAFDNLMRNVDAIHAYCRDVLHVPFVLFVMPRYFQYDPRLSPDNWEKAHYSVPGPYSLEPFRYFDAIATQKPYPVISLLPDFKQTDVFPTTFQDDPHLNEEGNAFAARTIWSHLLQLHVLPPPVAQP